MSPQINEFQCIMPMTNISSVLEHGILSHAEAARLPHHSVALPAVQERRDQIRIPGGLMLHHYANLYFHARNPMLYKRREEAPQLCVLRISTEITKLAGVVITDRNAAAKWMRAFPPDQIECLDLGAIFSRDWRHPNDENAYRLHRAQKCAEVLVPHLVPPGYIMGAYVSNDTADAALRELGFSLPSTVDPDLFFCSP